WGGGVALAPPPRSTHLTRGSDVWSSSVTTTAAIPGVRVDERITGMPVWKRLMIRPEFGALAGAIVVWILFATQAREVWLSWAGTATYLDTSALYGLSAIAIALLMIGGEFDLSSGVMVGTSGMFAALFSVHSGYNLWLAMGLSLLICLAIGFLN